MDLLMQTAKTLSRYDRRDIRERLNDLNDLELAVLVSLVAEHHCIINTNATDADEVTGDLRSICANTFGRKAATVHCSSETTVDDFNEAILIAADDAEDETSDVHDRHVRPTLKVNFAQSRASRSLSPEKPQENRRIADVVIAYNLDAADERVQTQALELIRATRIFTRRAMHTAPKDFLFIAVIPDSGTRLTHHLNDLFCMSHSHDADDGPTYPDGDLGQNTMPVMPMADVKHFREQASSVRMTGEIASYLHNVALFLRTSRYVTSGVTATATKHLRTLATALAPLHGLDYVAPSLVVLAAHKIYAHRLILATAETERSLQWGSDQDAIRRLLEDITVEGVIEDAIASVETPL